MDTQNRNKSQTGWLVFLLVVFLLAAVILFFLLGQRQTETEVIIPTLRPTILTVEPSATVTLTATTAPSQTPTVTLTQSPTTSPTVSETPAITPTPPTPTSQPGTPIPEFPPLPAVVAVNIPAPNTGGVRHYGKYSELQDGGHLMVGFPATGSVSSASFFIDMYEVTNGQMVAYLNASSLTSISLADWPSEFAQWVDTFKPEAPIKQDESGRWVVIRGENIPARWVSALAARAYCHNRGARLPTLEDWRLAAFWSEENPQRAYPWGDVSVEAKRAVYGAKEPMTVGQLVEGRSWIGAFDMAGNVAEWVQLDEHTFGYIGGSFEDDVATLEKAIQNVTLVDASWALPNVGFRCVK